MDNALASTETAEEKAVYAKVTWRLIPFLFLCYIVAYLDRVNVGFAKLQMLADLKFSDAVYGAGAGIFFLGYFLFEVPSNIFLHKVGARVWIARIMISWGVISSAMMFVNSELTFYAMRFVLGVAEAGFFPGIVLYLTYWYPSTRRGKMTTLFMTAIPVSSVIGGPLSGWIMQTMGGVSGLTNWQWLFVLEGIPSIVVGLITLAYLDDSILGAKWLNDDEKKLLKSHIDQDVSHKEDHSIGQAMASPRVWLMGAIYFCFVMGLYGVSFWLPTIIKGLGVKDALDIGLLSAIPFATAAIGMNIVSRSADANRERRWHVAIPALIGAAGLVASAVLSSNAVLAMIALSIATFGIITTLPLFWSMPTAYLGGVAAAAGIALINSVGNLAGYFSPTLIGLIKDATKSTDAGMYMLATSLVIGAVLTLAFVPAKLVNR